ncbi:MAG: DNRLRE domain-containing protein, partial [Algicola sp.]|nr:DNRLRE domain-containing protein [Algicola sp.]
MMRSLNPICSVFKTTLISACLLAGAVQAQTFEFVASQNAEIQQNNPDVNYGTVSSLALTPSDDVRRILLNFDLSALLGQVAGNDVDSAVISLRVFENNGNWSKGKKGRIDIHQLEQNSGWLSADRISNATTWHCAQDLNLSNGQSDCDQPWAGGVFDRKAAAHVDVHKVMSNIIRLDVTKQIKQLLDDNQGQSGWLLKKNRENKSGAIVFAAIQGDDSPKLTINANT